MFETELFLLWESFNKPQDRKFHFNKHATETGVSRNRWGNIENDFTREEFPTEEDYEAAADELAMKPAKYSIDPRDVRQGNFSMSNITGIIGFQTKTGRYVKYDPGTGELVVYVMQDGEPIVITYYMCSNERFIRLVRKDFWRNL